MIEGYRGFATFVDCLVIPQDLFGRVPGSQFTYIAFHWASGESLKLSGEGVLALRPGVTAQNANIVIALREDAIALERVVQPLRGVFAAFVINMGAIAVANDVEAMLQTIFIHVGENVQVVFDFDQVILGAREGDQLTVRRQCFGDRRHRFRFGE